MDLTPSLEKGNVKKFAAQYSLPIFLNQGTRLTAIVLGPTKADHEKAGRQTRLEKIFATKKCDLCNMVGG